jgi:hypothetical protein
MLWGNSYLGLRDCLDGTSNVFLVSERDYVHHAATWVGVGRNDSYGNEGTLRTLFRASFTLNYDYTGVGQPQNQGKGAASLHPGGVQFLLCDASVHFVSESTNKDDILRLLSLRADSEPVETPW